MYEVYSTNMKQTQQKKRIWKDWRRLGFFKDIKMYTVKGIKYEPVIPFQPTMARNNMLKEYCHREKICIVSPAKKKENMVVSFTYTRMYVGLRISTLFLVGFLAAFNFLKMCIYFLRKHCQLSFPFSFFLVSTQQKSFSIQKNMCTFTGDGMEKRESHFLFRLVL